TIKQQQVMADQAPQPPQPQTPTPASRGKPLPVLSPDDLQKVMAVPVATATIPAVRKKVFPKTPVKCARATTPDSADEEEHQIDLNQVCQPVFHQTPTFDPRVGWINHLQQP